MSDEQITQALDIVRAVDRSDGAYESDSGWLHCIFCHGDEDPSTPPEEHGPIMHTADCPVTKARELLETYHDE